MRASLTLAALAVVLLPGPVASAQIVRPIRPMVPIGPPQTIGSAASRAASSVQSAIHGTATDANAAPLPNTTVRLRNLQTNQVEQISTSNGVGEFSFAAQADIPYVIEIVDQAGQVIAVGDVIAAQVGEVAGAIVSIPTRLPAIAGVFGDTAGSVISAATGSGITAVEATATQFDSPSR